MKLVHISDTHGAKHHTKLIIPECDVLIHSGDLGGRTTLFELTNQTHNKPTTAGINQPKR
jgi:predicted phosphodiesterase